MRTYPIIEAAERGDQVAVQRYIAEGADINVQDAQGRTAIMAATYGNKLEVVRVLLAAGADLNVQDNRLDNPLLFAGAAGLPAIIKLLVEAGADTSITNRYGGTALIPACERGHVEAVRILLTYSDVNVNHINRLGWTALMEAIVLSDGGPDHQRIVQMLVEHGADVNIPDKDGVLPLRHARRRGYKRMEETLLHAAAREY
ncbi:MAG: ankyrin [Paenibacillus sp.]|nr:ankyrin [Paenibacillus sp.]